MRSCSAVAYFVQVLETGWDRSQSIPSPLTSVTVRTYSPEGAFFQAKITSPVASVVPSTLTETFGSPRSVCFNYLILIAESALSRTEYRDHLENAG